MWIAKRTLLIKWNDFDIFHVFLSASYFWRFEFIIHLIVILELCRFYFWILSNKMFDLKIESKISFLLLLAIISYLQLLEFVVSYDSLNLWITLAEGFFLSIFWFFCGQSALIEAVVNFDPEMTPKGSFRFLLRFLSQFFIRIVVVIGWVLERVARSIDSWHLCQTYHMSYMVVKSPLTYR